MGSTLAVLEEDHELCHEEGSLDLTLCAYEVSEVVYRKTRTRTIEVATTTKRRGTGMPMLACGGRCGCVRYVMGRLREVFCALQGSVGCSCVE